MTTDGRRDLIWPRFEAELAARLTPLLSSVLIAPTVEPRIDPASASKRHQRALVRLKRPPETL